MNILGIKNLWFWRNYTTGQWGKWWQKRQIDWQKEYLATWNDPHRHIISGILSTFKWFSLIEVGCGGGANLVNIVKHFPNRQIGGVDINPKAIEACRNALKNAILKVNPADDIMMSDNASDVVLTDMTLIYIGPFKIKKHIKELIRVSRDHLVLCEFHSNSFWERLWLRIRSGHNAYNYKKLLIQHGCYDVVLYKVPDDAYAKDNNNKFKYIIKCKIPRQ